MLCLGYQKQYFLTFLSEKGIIFFARFFAVDCKLLICHCVWEFKHLYFCCVLFVVLFLCLFLCRCVCLCVCLFVCLYVYNSRVVNAHVSKFFITVVNMLICGQTPTDDTPSHSHSGMFYSLLCMPLVSMIPKTFFVGTNVIKLYKGSG